MGVRFCAFLLSPHITMSVFVCMYMHARGSVWYLCITIQKRIFLAFGPQHLPRNSDALVMEDPPQSLARFFGKDEDACLCSVLCLTSRPSRRPKKGAYIDANICVYCWHVAARDTFVSSLKSAYPSLLTLSIPRVTLTLWSWKFRLKVWHATKMLVSVMSFSYFMISVCPVTLLSIMLLWAMSMKAWFGYILAYKP